MRTQTARQRPCSKSEERDRQLSMYEMPAAEIALALVWMQHATDALAHERIALAQDATARAQAHAREAQRLLGAMTAYPYTR